METRKVTMLTNHKIGRMDLTEGDTITLEKSVADMLVEVGHAKDAVTGEEHEMSMKPVRVSVKNIEQFQ